MRISSVNDSDPFDVLGLPHDASETEVRSRYLELVKKYPPDRAPDKFREIRAAYEATSDPLSRAMRLVEPPLGAPPEWTEALEISRKVFPNLEPSFLLSLGNREARASASIQPNNESA